jgi:hypothetical protein
MVKPATKKTKEPLRINIDFASRLMESSRVAHTAISRAGQFYEKIYDGDSFIPETTEGLDVDLPSE